ncbi:hypothetical protein TSUD_50340 [Trifolium subterraneum]|uniref:Uncharacterized protein n=1 Tax=Trifolium subterraneum TaxID=3900 RepID=A0A2Z6LWV4_TRISU|nr:hypothetical protein TSUD_50340 [Trifolium subterraneum]
MGFCATTCRFYIRNPDLLSMVFGDSPSLREEFEESIPLQREHCCYYHWLTLLMRSRQKKIHTRPDNPPNVESVSKRRVTIPNYPWESIKMATADSSSSSKPASSRPLLKKKKKKSIKLAAASSSPSSKLAASGHSESLMVKCSTSTAAASDLELPKQ